MKLKFKKQAYQTNAVEAVANCFAGQHGYIRLHIYPSDSDFFRCFIGFDFFVGILSNIIFGIDVPTYC